MCKKLKKGGLNLVYKSNKNETILSPIFLLTLFWSESP